MHTMDAGWPHLQVAGITNTLKDYGIEVIGATDAKFNVGQQISDLEQMIARKPDVIFSIPIDPKSSPQPTRRRRLPASSWSSSTMSRSTWRRARITCPSSRPTMKRTPSSPRTSSPRRSAARARSASSRWSTITITRSRRGRSGRRRLSPNIRTSRWSASARSHRPKRPMRWRQACSPPIQT